MSVSLSAVQQKVFDAQVKAAYKSSGNLLRGTFRMRENIQGTTCDFRKADYITAEEYAFQTSVVAQDPNFSKVTCTLKPYRAATLIDDVEQWLVNFDERAEDAVLLAQAVGRRVDQVGINALAASGTANTIANGGEGLTFPKVRAINKFFNKKAVPHNQRYIAITATAEDQIMSSLQFTNNQFTQLNAVTKGSLNGAFVMGMNWIVIPDMDEGGLPLSGNIRTCFAWNKMAMGMATGRIFGTQIERRVDIDSWQCLSKIFVGNTAVDAVGVISCDIDESVDEVSALTVTTIVA